jgi:hypothetical protein
MTFLGLMDRNAKDGTSGKAHRFKKRHPENTLKTLNKNDIFLAKREWW